MTKKQQPLAPEDRLTAALVPEEEWPYALPEGWKWVYGKGFLLPMETEYPTGKSFRYIDIESIDNNVQRVRSPKKLSVQKAPSRASRKLHTGDTLFSMVRPYLKNIAYIDEECSNCIGSTGFYVCTPTASVDSRYLYWLMVSPYVVNGLNHFMKGDNSPSIRKGDIENFSYPLPPLSDQRRLVARIESLFAKLDAAREKVQSVLDSHETRKAALLHDAFTGKLTARWREEQSAKISSWKTMSFEDCIEKMQNGLSKRRGDSGEYVNVLRLTNIAPESLSFQDMRKILLTPDEKKKYKLAPEDVLMVRVNGSKDNVGKQLYIDKKDAEHQLTFCDHLIRIHYNGQLVSPRFMVYFSHTMQYKSYIEKNMVSSAGQNTISRKGMKNLSLRLPSLPEQEEIVRILNRLLAREQRARQAAEETLAAIDRMKQSILARAFRGEL